MNPAYIRNFSIIAHIDHGKSTLADRLLEQTGNLQNNDASQILDTMELEKERGITIKAQAVRLSYNSPNANKYQLNLIDTPGHVDFAHEVSKSLQACEGALLVIDATQGVQAQTLAHTYFAIEHDIEIIPVINKVDLDIAEPKRISREISQLLGFKSEDIIFASAKDGTGINEILEAIVKRIPPPKGNTQNSLQGLIFDSKYDPYKGAIAYIRILEGQIKQGEMIKLMSNNITSETVEIGYFEPEPMTCNILSTGEVGYLATGLKKLGDLSVGDTITSIKNSATKPLKSYAKVNPTVFASIYPVENENLPVLKDALQKLILNDSSLQFEPETSLALGSGYRCGFLGLLHMDIVQERLEREYGLNLIATSPSVIYNITKKDGQTLKIDNPSKMPPTNEIDHIDEPYVHLTIITPSGFIGTLMKLATARRGNFKKLEYLNETTAPNNIHTEIIETNKPTSTNTNPKKIIRIRVSLEFDIPLSEILIDFYDKLKSITQGYASMDYTAINPRPANLVKMDIFINGENVDALAIIAERSSAYDKGRKLVDKIKELIPRQLFAVAIQAGIGNKIIARSTISALRKNVLAKCYGGDVTRKRKLLQKQAAGKKRMKRLGKVDIPQEVFLSVLTLNQE